MCAWRTTIATVEPTRASGLDLRGSSAAACTKGLVGSVHVCHPGEGAHQFGLARLGQGMTVEARDAFASSLRIAHRLGYLEVIATTLIGSAAISEAARQLGMHRRSFQRKLAKYPSAR